MMLKPGETAILTVRIDSKQNQAHKYPHQEHRRLLPPGVGVGAQLLKSRCPGRDLTYSKSSRVSDDGSG
jgi:hypothetical protein